MNPFYNNEEKRLRAGFRIIIFVFLSFLVMGFGLMLPLGGIEYIFATVGIFMIFWLSFRFTDNRFDISLAGLEISPGWWKEYSIGVLIGFVAMALIFLTEWLMGDLEVVGFGWEAVSHKVWFVPVLIFLLQMCCVGFYEELTSRSYLITNFKEGLTIFNINPATATFFAIVISSSLFGVAHAGNPNVTLFAVVNIVVAGVMLAIPYVMTGNLSYSVGLHTSWNFFQAGFFGFKVSGITVRNSVINISQGGNDLWTGGTFGPEGGIIGLTAVLLISVFFVIYLRKRNNGVLLHSSFQKTFLQNKEESLAKSDELA